ncbi:ABC transporter permease [Altererythrobacter salegens]|uniref:ABC transporter permease n=1 Tax=Croceibacterium salegens TaxID=1737568 RepID=A0A6I4SV29_9SPHN|nr:ABC transporter permease [Croceibacterium salegens]MXO59875.1 ABC transporter permease [Croceibacterium salegens]
MNEQTPKSRLSLLRAALVIARRDFAAILFSRVFFFFLLGPLFPIIVGALAGGIGSSLDSSAGEPEIAVAMTASDEARLFEAHKALRAELGPGMPLIRQVAELQEGEEFDAPALLDRREGNIAAVLSGTLERPVLTAPESRLGMFRGSVALLTATALGKSPEAFPPVATQVVATSGASDKRGRLATAQAGQTLLFLLIMLLAGMVLSNLVEEKANKIIEILAAAIPMDAVFMGKLFAMLGVSLVGLALWGTVIGGLVTLSDMQGPVAGFVDFSKLPEPGVGWPLFFVLGVVYFSMGYLLLGSIFLAIGSLATTVREVQTMSMPVTMSQVLLFFFASYAMAKPGEPVELLAIAFPLSSPFAMLARAALSESVFPHVVAVAWQALWVFIAVRLGARLFRKRVMKSGPQPVKAKRGLFRKGSARPA